MLPLVTWRQRRAMGGRELSAFVDRGGFHWCKPMIAARMAYGSSPCRQSLIAPQRVVLGRFDLLVPATSADMVCPSRLSQQTFLHLLGRSNWRRGDRVRMATRVWVACWPMEMADGCDSGWERAACRCESRSGFAGAGRRACMCVRQLARAIGDGSARRPCQAPGAGRTSRCYDVLWMCKSRGQGAICGSMDGSRMAMAAGRRW